MSLVTIRAYPWGKLDRVPRATVQALRSARRDLPSAPSPERVAAVLGELVGATIELRAQPAAVAPARERFAEVTLSFGGASLGVGVAPDLAGALLGRLLGRPFSLSSHDPGLDPALLGALGALVVEVAGRVLPEPLTLVSARLGGAPVALDVTVTVDRRVHAAYVLVGESTRVVPTTPPTLAELGDVDIALSLVVALSLATRAELDALRPGSAWLPGAGAWTNVLGVGRGVLVAPHGERGVWVDLTADGRVVLGKGTAELAPDAPSPGDGDMADAKGNDTLTDAVLEAPVVVRVELGSVSMPASDWARLRPGDVLETGQRLTEPVVLRIAGRAVARGELVDVDGELGVRVRELIPSER